MLSFDDPVKAKLNNCGGCAVLEDCVEELESKLAKLELIGEQLAKLEDLEENLSHLTSRFDGS